MFDAKILKHLDRAATENAETLVEIPGYYEDRNGIIQHKKFSECAFLHWIDKLQEKDGFKVSPPVVTFEDGQPNTGRFTVTVRDR